MAEKIKEEADLATIMDDLSSLKRDFATMLAHMKSSAATTVNGATQNAVDSLSGEAQRLYQNVTAQGKQSVGALSARVEEQPLMSLLIAFGVGFLGGRFLSR